ncbi:hypothetical protein [Azospirillum sp. B510]|uniref:hypothetical protein n=1 Tax=Azospirillum sp. (strain B510) TaxID=137722 RepID=UPI0020005A06|nr:hypothetical protein [Azospirillum sp. B510]
MTNAFELVIAPEYILNHGNFSESRRVYIGEMLRLHENKAALNRLIFDQGRAFMFFTIITMHAGYRPEERQTWPTVEALKQHLEQLGLASGWRMHDFIRRLSDIGYVENLPVDGDRRVKVLRPTEAMLAHDRQTLNVYYRPLQAMFPVPGYCGILQGDPTFQRAAREIGFSFFAHAQQFITANPTIAYFLPRQGGMMILTKLMQLWLQHGDETWPKVSFVGMGDSFGISRTHVRKLLMEAETVGLVQRRGDAVMVTPEGRAGFDRYLADTMAGNDLVYRLALERVAVAA